MTQRTVTLRISSALIQRLDQLCELHKADPHLSPRGRLTRADILREALLRGCTELERMVVPGTPQPSPTEGALIPFPWGRNEALPPALPPLLTRLPVDDPTAIGDAMDAEFERFDG